MDEKVKRELVRVVGEKNVSDTLMDLVSYPWHLMDFSFLLTRHPERAGQIFEEPRSILKRIPGVEVVEMTRNRMDARCCGGGAPSPIIPLPQVVPTCLPSLSIAPSAQARS